MIGYADSTVGDDYFITGNITFENTTTELGFFVRGDAQEEDGYLYTAWSLRANEYNEFHCCSYSDEGRFEGTSGLSHEFYNAGHMYEAAVAHYLATGRRNFLDVALTFPKPYPENYCFIRIGEVPGGKYYQHYLRLYRKDDINNEVRKFMRMALDYGNKNLTFDPV